MRSYGLSENPADRARFGFSNGGAFVLAAAYAHPELFSTALPFSVAASDDLTPSPGPLPRIFLAAGQLEPVIAARTSSVYRALRAAGAKAAFEAYMSGHDSLMWDVALVHYMPEVFPPDK